MHVGILTTSSGSPVEYGDTITLNENLVTNEFFLDSMTHFVRERIPERVVHAKGAGAFGFFEVTNDLTHICKADFLNKVGKKTPVAVRFSPILDDRGGIDTNREIRGFAIKFYTDEGNFDLAGINTPLFPIKDPVLFPSLARVQKRNPATNLYDMNMLWDFFTLSTNSLFAVLMIFGDPGIPDGYRHMPGFGVHTYQVFNEHGEIYFVRWHILPDAGISTLTSEVAKKIAGEDSDYATRDLYAAIENGAFPSWTISLQILSIDDVKNADFNVFDVTKALPQDKYPLYKLGRLILNRNALNYFAEIEQLAFCPGNLVPGILGAPDKLFESRRMAYRDSQLYRLGANFNKITVNCPLRTKAFTYDRDGKPPVNDNGKGSPNYYPNSFDGPVPYHTEKHKLIKVIDDNSNNFEQAREYYVNTITEEERCRLVDNIVSSLGRAADFIQNRAVKLFTIIHPDFGYRVKEGLTANTTVSHWLK